MPSLVSADNGAEPRKSATPKLLKPYKNLTKDAKRRQREGKPPNGGEDE